GRGRADQHPAVGGVEVDARAIAEQRSPRAPRAGVDREDRHRAPLASPGTEQRRQQRRLSHARRPGQADHVSRRLASERRRGELLHRRRSRLGVGGGATPEKVQRGGRGAQVSLAQARAESGSVLVHAAATDPSGASDPPAEPEPPAEPLPAPTADPPFGRRPCSASTSSTMSRTMRVMSKSLGVYTAAPPAGRSGATPCWGMTPPTPTGAVTPDRRNASITAGISRPCDPDRIERPITCTPSCNADAAIWAGVRRMPSYTTSIPESRA